MSLIVAAEPKEAGAALEHLAAQRLKEFAKQDETEPDEGAEE